MEKVPGPVVRLTQARKPLREGRGRYVLSCVILFDQLPGVSYLQHSAHQFGYLLFLWLPKHRSEQTRDPQYFLLPFAI